jgi:hypothetical protein
VGRDVASVEVFPSVIGLMLKGDSHEHATDYFLVENRQRIGFDAALPGAGLCAYHVQDEYDAEGEYLGLGGMAVISLTTPALTQRTQP